MPVKRLFHTKIWISHLITFHDPYSTGEEPWSSREKLLGLVLVERIVSVAL